MEILEKLKSCPFCGSTNVYLSINTIDNPCSADDNVPYVECDCGIIVNFEQFSFCGNDIRLKIGHKEKELKEKVMQVWNRGKWR